MQLRIMTQPWTAVVLLMMLTFWTSVDLAQAPVPASQPTTQNSAANVTDVAALVAAGEYSDALRAINHLLPAAQGNSMGQDRYQLLMLRADCQLHLKARDATVATLEEIAKGCGEVSDEAGQSQAIAFATLIQRSNNFVYIPKTQPDKTPLSILDPDSRKLAYIALLSDEVENLRSQQNMARTTKSLSPLVDIAQDFSRTAAIERAATGSAARTSSLAKELSKWATAEVEKALDDEDEQITQIAAEIGRRSNGGSRRSSSVRRGLDQDQSDTLTNISTECRKVPALAEQLSKALGQPDILSTSLRAQAIAERADIVLEGGYAPPVKKTSRSSK